MISLQDGRKELFQWDTNRYIVLDKKIGDVAEIHFANGVFNRSIDVKVEEGKALIPDVLLQYARPLRVWVFVGESSDGYTKVEHVFKVNERNKPSDYVFTPTEQLSLQELIEKFEDFKDSIGNEVEEYLKENPVDVVEKDPTVPQWAKLPNKPTYTAAEVGARSDRWLPTLEEINAQPKGDYALKSEIPAIPDAPVKSVNGKTGEVKLTAKDVGALEENVDLVTPEEVEDAIDKYMQEHPAIVEETDPTVADWAKKSEKPSYTPEEIGAQPKGDYALKSEIPAVLVQSVNGKTGIVQLSAADVGALPQDTTIPAPYTLPTASAEVKGGVKVGSGLQMDGDALEAEVKKADVDKLSEEIAFKPEAYGLPMLYLTGSIEGMNKDDSVTLDYVFGERSGTCDVKWQGSSSLQFPKKNYTIKFDEAFEAVEGWGAQKKYCAKANWVDFSHARNVVSAKLWGQVVRKRRIVPEMLASLLNGGAIDGFPIGITINGKYNGLYTLNIPKDGWMFGLGNGTKECIMCANHHSAATRFEGLAVCDETDFEIEYISDESNTQWAINSLNNLISAVMASDGTDIDTTLAKYVDIDSAIDFYIFTALQAGSDNYDKNYILVTFDGVKWYFSTYDMDSTFGNRWNGTGYNLATTEAPTIANFNHKLIRLIRDYKTSAVKARYEILRNSVLSEENVAMEFYNFIAGIPKAMLDEEVRIWPTIPGTATNNVAQIVSYYGQRRKAMDAQMDAVQAVVKYINLVPTSTDPQTGEIYGGIGYKNNMTAAGPDYGWEEAAEGYVTTGLISFPAFLHKAHGDYPYVSPVMYIKGDVTFEAGGNCRVIALQEDGTKAASCYGEQIATYFIIEELGTGYYKLTYAEVEVEGVGTQNKIRNWIDKTVESVQLTFKGVGEGLIVTVDEPIE